MSISKSIRPAVSVVIPAYNEEKYIAGCLQALCGQKTDEPYEVIVVDNNSTDRTRSIAQTFPVTVITERKKGYGEAGRSGVRKAKAPIIAMTDADTIVNPGWIGNIIRAYRSHPDYIAIGGAYEFYDGPPAVRLFVKVFNILSPRLLTRSLCGMNMSFLRSAYDAVGGFEQGINLQADQVLGRKLKKYGKVVFLMNNIAYSSARRYTSTMRIIRELCIRGVNTARFAFSKKPAFTDQTDFR